MKSTKSKLKTVETSEFQLHVAVIHPSTAITTSALVNFTNRTRTGEYSTWFGS